LAKLLHKKIKELTMKKIIGITVLLFGVISCDNNQGGSITTSDSTSVMSTQVYSDTLNGNGGTGATGTTDTGTVSDSGNAAHPGSDTSYHAPEAQ
jgi:hypothetical protein